MENKGITNVEIRIGIGFIICLLISKISPEYVQALAACTAIIMCTQNDGKSSFMSGWVRVKGVIIGGICAAIVVLLDATIDNTYAFIILCGIGVVCNLLCCQYAKMPNVIARVSCITFALVALVGDGNFRLEYALLRLLGTFIGAVVALLIAYIWDGIGNRKAHSEI